MGGAVDLSASAGAPPGLAFNFTCQRQLDMWVTVAPAAGAHPRTGAVAGVAAVYQQYAQATGLPAPLPERAALFWQCRDFYHNQSEVIALPVEGKTNRWKCPRNSAKNSRPLTQTRAP